MSTLSHLERNPKTQQFSRNGAASVYRDALSRLGFLQDMAIISVVGTRQSALYGHGRLEATLVAMLRRMRTALVRAKPARQGMIFFDEGHGEYTKAELGLGDLYDYIPRRA
jgi:hypothetical protein